MARFKPVADRIRDLSFPDPNSGCWVWSGAIDRCGYGKLTSGRESLAHRNSYAVFVGPIPDGHDVDHKCKNRGCVNPHHLEAVTHAENVRRADHLTNHRNRIKTMCKRGHPFDAANTHIEIWGGVTMRKCRICRDEKNRLYRLKAKLFKAIYGREILET